MKPPRVSSAPVETEPPVVTQSTSNETADSYEQQSARRKGILSTILSNRRAGQSAPSSGGNTTLG